MAFAYIGSRAHAKLELADTDASLLEEFLEDDELTGTPDCLEEEGEAILTDYKTWGSYRLAMALGIVQVGKTPDPSGAVYKTSGKWGKAGTPKMIPVYAIDPSRADNREATLQLNRYRMLYQSAGFTVDRMQLQVFVRDGGLISAKQRGVDRKIYLVEIKRLDDAAVQEFFTAKRHALLEALATEQLPPPCNQAESWNGRRCQSFCDVAEFCNVGLAVRTKDETKGDENA
jgi:hypothetical protein